MLNRLKTQLNKPKFTKVSKVVEPTIRKRYYKTLGTSFSAFLYTSSMHLKRKGYNYRKKEKENTEKVTNKRKEIKNGSYEKKETHKWKNTLKS